MTERKIVATFIEMWTEMNSFFTRTVRKLRFPALEFLPAPRQELVLVDDLGEDG